MEEISYIINPDCVGFLSLCLENMDYVACFFLVVLGFNLGFGFLKSVFDF